MPVNPNDPRSTVGNYLRGKNVYGGGGTAPNPMGNNQYPNLQAAAKLKRKRRNLGLITEPTIRVNSLLTDKGGNFT